MGLAVEAIAHLTNHYGQMVKDLRMNGHCSTRQPVAALNPELRGSAKANAALADFTGVLVATEELPNGYLFHPPGERKPLVVVVDLILVERECCPLPTLQLSVESRPGPIKLRITSAEGAKEFLKSLLM